MKIVGISSSTTENRTVLNTAYHNAFSRPGIVSVAFPILPAPNREVLTADQYQEQHKERIDALVQHVDCVVISGGSDCSPLTFDDRNWASTACDMERDFMELALMRAALVAHKPIMGICKGFQLINRAFGLPFFTQDLGASGVKEMHNGLEHELKDRAEPAHSIYLFGDFRDYVRAQTGQPDLATMRCSSYHHQGFLVTKDGKIPKADGGSYAEKYAQAIRTYEDIGDIKVIGATAAVVEAVEKADAQYVGSQAHPEETPDSLIINYWLSRYVLNV